ncbi:chromosome partitioning protein ParA [Vibrio aestuarianus]|uniref:chromosome partitioning protein ParA n=1 Tax=Vibrio aestuarianus TaxID=28171 RepID=UPI0015937CAE|nr:chromosome partitioning protein ParA [Vibrio aestuarianus]MDE1234052.1 chromosome partitioning protein ParA [Vibrio aestuarianus]MDE1244944.1 chromosome partitioning protein ParA [Vibrio aestuarianus]NGZ62207.1 chromosome partitioning protein ParA [Vibrio aestuarianus subsp. cardii]
MVSINGLPPSIVPGSNKTNRANKKNEVRKGDTKAAVGPTTKVANAVSHSIRQVQEADIQRATLEYDLPEGRARKAMEEYMDVMNQAKKEELAQMLGVDIYI